MIISKDGYQCHCKSGNFAISSGAKSNIWLMKVYELIMGNVIVSNMNVGSATKTQWYKTTDFPLLQIHSLTW